MFFNLTISTMYLKYNFHSFKINLKLHHTFQMFEFTSFSWISHKNGPFLVNLKGKVLKPLRICFLWRKFWSRKNLSWINVFEEEISKVRGFLLWDFLISKVEKWVKEIKKTYLWVSVFFLWLKREISKVKERFLV